MERSDSEEKIEYNENKYLKTFKGLSYFSNSCYLDSILIALFSSYNPVIDDLILKKNISKLKKQWKGNTLRLQYELNDIAKYISGTTTTQEKFCDKLRSLCISSQNFDGIGMQDAGEFILFLFGIFEVETMTKHRITYVTNNLEDNDNLLTTFSEVQISSPMLTLFLNKPYLQNLKESLESIEDSILSEDNLYKGYFRRRIEVTKVISSIYLIINVQRTDYRPVEIPRKIGSLKLGSVVCFFRQHYVCFSKYNHNWYYYDDMATNKVMYIGSLKDTLKKQINPSHNGVLFFYN